MIDEYHATASEPRRFASVFDAFPPGTPPSLDDLELAKCLDLERRCLAAIDRALVLLAAPATVPTDSAPADARR